MPADGTTHPIRLLPGQPFFNTDRALSDAFAAIDLRVRAEEAALGYSSRDWLPRGADGLAESMEAAKGRAERLGESE